MLITFEPIEPNNTRYADVHPSDETAAALARELRRVRAEHLADRVDEVRAGSTPIIVVADEQVHLLGQAARAVAEKLSVDDDWSELTRL